MAAKCKFVFT